MARTRRHIARMSTSTPVDTMMRRYDHWCKTVSPSDPDRGPWIINNDLNIITHKSTSCNLCRDWLGHLLDSIADQDKSLKDARYALETASDVQVDVDDAERNRDEAVQILASVRHELEVARDTLMQARQERDRDAKKTYAANAT